MQHVWTAGDLAAYWGAVAQIIPVLALAFVIEARLVVRRLSRKRDYARRGLRLRWGIVFFAVGVLLTSSEVTALQNLASRPSKVLDGSDYFVFWVSLIAVVVTLAIVITMPVTKLVVASTYDVSRWLEMRVPWGAVPRLRREIVEQLQKIEELLRNLQQARLDAAIGCASSLLSTDEGAQVRLLEAVERLVDDPHVDVFDAEGELRALMWSDRHDSMWGYRITRWLYEHLVRQTRDAQSLRKTIRRQLKRLDKLKRADSPELAAIQRANMTAAAKMQ